MAGAIILIVGGIGFTGALGWVALDAAGRTWRYSWWTVAGWLALCFFLWCVGFPVYVIRRRRAPLAGHVL